LVCAVDQERVLIAQAPNRYWPAGAVEDNWDTDRISPPLERGCRLRSPRAVPRVSWQDEIAVDLRLQRSRQMNAENGYGEAIEDG
jgi:hypothetical protein